MTRHRTARVLSRGIVCLVVAPWACGGDGSTSAVGPDELEPYNLVASVEIVPPQQFFGSLGLSKRILAVAGAPWPTVRRDRANSGRAGG